MLQKTDVITDQISYLLQQTYVITYQISNNCRYGSNGIGIAKQYSLHNHIKFWYSPFGLYKNLCFDMYLLILHYRQISSKESCLTIIYNCKKYFVQQIFLYILFKNARFWVKFCHFFCREYARSMWTALITIKHMVVFTNLRITGQSFV